MVAPVTTTFLVIRHAESEANAGSYFASQSDSQLTANGREQVARLAAAFATAPVDVVYSSDLSRARDTVAPIAAARGLQLHETPLLRERDMGGLTGLSFEQVRAEHPEIWARLLARDPTLAPLGGESAFDLAARVARFTDGLAARHAGQTVVLGSHGVAIQHIVRLLLGITDLSIPLWIQSSNTGVHRIEVFETAGVGTTARLAYANRVLPAGAEPMLP